MSNSLLQSIVSAVDHLHGCVLVDTAGGGIVASVGLEPTGSGELVQAVGACVPLTTGDAAGRVIVEREAGTLVLQQVAGALWAALSFDERAPLGLVRILSADAAGELARADFPAPANGADAPTPTPTPAAEPLRAKTPEPVVAGPSPGRKLLDYLDANAPDTHAALLRVSLQTGLPLSLLKTPDELSTAEFEQVTLSVQRILGVEMLAL